MPLNKRADKLQNEPRFPDSRPVSGFANLCKCPPSSRARSRPLTEMQNWVGALHSRLETSLYSSLPWHWDLWPVDSTIFVGLFSFFEPLLDLPPYLKRLHHLIHALSKVILNAISKDNYLQKRVKITNNPHREHKALGPVRNPHILFRFTEHVHCITRLSCLEHYFPEKEHMESARKGALLLCLAAISPNWSCPSVRPRRAGAAMSGCLAVWLVLGPVHQTRPSPALASALLDRRVS